MATAPTRVSFIETAYNTTTSPKATSSFDVQSGDLIVIYGYTPIYETTLNTPTWTGSGTVTLQQSVNVVSYASTYCWTINVTATQTGRTISCASAGTSFIWGFNATIWRNHGGIGVSNKATTTGAPSLALTGSANSAMQVGVNDWNGINGSSRTWRTVNGSAMTEADYTYVTDAGSGYYTIYSGYSPDIGSASSKTLGLSAPSGQQYAIIGIEILGAGSEIAKTSTLTENFDSGTIDSAKWGIGSGDGVMAQTSGALTFTLASNTSGYSYNTLWSYDSYDLTNSEIIVEIPQKVGSSQGTEQQLILELDSNNNIWFIIDGPMYIYRFKTAGVDADSYLNPYPVTDRWWRIRESSGTIYWEASPDRSNWSVLYSAAVTFAVSALTVTFCSGTWQPIASPGVAKFDNLNLETPTYRNTAEGQTNGTTLSAANSGGGSGDAFDTITTSGTIARTFSTEQSMFGVQSYKIVPSASSAIFCRVNAPASSYSASVQMYLYLPAYPDNNQMFMQIRSASAAVCDFNINQTGVVRIGNAAGSNVTTSGAGAFPTGQWMRLDLSAVIGTTTSNGRINAQLSVANSFTPSWSYSSGATVNTGTAAIAEYRYGKLDTAPAIAPFYFDNTAWRSNMSAFIPAESSTPSIAWFVA